MNNDFYTKADPDVVVEKILQDNDYITYDIRVDHVLKESGLSEYSVDEELGSEDWRDDVKVIDKRTNRDDSKSPCDFCNKPIYDCVDCEKNLFNIILSNVV